jgi:hypothetical protein
MPGLDSASILSNPVSQYPQVVSKPAQKPSSIHRINGVLYGSEAKVSHIMRINLIKWHRNNEETLGNHQTGVNP